MTDETKVTDLDDVQPEAPTEPKKRVTAKAKQVEQADPEAPKEKGVEVKAKTTGNGLSGQKVDITIHNGEGDAGKLPVDVGINGYTWRIKRGIRVTVPREVVGALQNAVQDSYDSSGVTRTPVPRFPMTVHF